ncbi:DUF418 domain-containing protein [Frankia sp. CNm7]|uniref:DUF418 domain-containing protein n=1 Tax=Frankia nepalensis TaxID=1836974 RepID=A0A937RL03_9ACTN|nr:DUF418 domain-containing protein [Frankia nepalensis]MBL7495182.1 DUF418 domain-containing protein [Frankia nepalensis]MBL7512198.1 DUF418 domain-containing protein [Frankia nepalensis]MBL7519165.1 DUF418 domain-containing protein [Frankia nepalensis]MBL7629259.1 DUF418 domain-containing protein [Frankia nepalensis]
MTLEARALGPDLARGFMLLFIALANSHYFLRGSSVLGGYPRDGSGVDAAAIWLISTFVDGRAFPMFGLLFGYGVAQIVRRHEELGPRRVRRLLWRRAAVLVVVGFLHAVLLFAGDILAAYGVLLLLGAWLVRWKDRWLLLTALLFFALISLPSDGSLTISSDPPGASMLPPDVATMVVERAKTSAFVSLFGPIGFITPFAVGLWAGRRRILEQPESHRALLRVTASVGIGAAVLGAQPISLMLAGVVTPPDQPTLEVLGPLHDATGTLGGFGYAALLSLIAARVQARPRPVVDAIAAVGQRSMTCYLAQSVVWAAVFTPFLLDLSDTLTVTTTAVLAVMTWLVTVLLASWMRRAGRRGPFEALIRRVTYSSTGSRPAGPPSPPSPSSPDTVASSRL